MSDITVENEKVDFSTGAQMFSEFYEEREIMCMTWDDFLKLPKSEGYTNNPTRIPNDFRQNVIDKKDDPLMPILVMPKVNDDIESDS